MYYKVLAKCGHVGQRKYILKCFYLKANDAKEAALLVRNKSRVKHHHKDAIREVVKIEFDEYMTGLKIMNDDMYFHVHNFSDQKLYNCVNQEEIFQEVPGMKYKKKRNGQRLRTNIKEKEMIKEIKGELKYD